MKKPAKPKANTVKKKTPPRSKTKINGTRQTADIYRSLVEATTDSVYMVDSTCRYIYANPRYCARLKLSLAEIIARPYGDFHSPEETASFESDVAQIFRKALPFQREYTSRRDANEFLRTFYPIKKPAGTVYAAAIIAKDITALRHAQELYSTLAQNSPISVMIIQDGFIKWVNSKMRETTGYTDKELFDKSFESFLHPEDRESAKNNSLSLLKGQSSLQYEYRVLAKNGDYLWHLGTVSLITYRGKKAVLKSHMDITAHKQTELQLRQSEERYRSIIDTITDAYYEVDLAGNATVFNESYLNLYEYSAEEMQGKNYREYVDQEKAKMAYWVFHQVFETGKPTKKMEWEIIAKSGRKKQVELSVSLIRDAQGKPQGFRGIMSDVTQRRRAEEIIRHQAFHDPLTGLANRLLFYDRMQMAFKLAKRNQTMVAVVILDIDKFKEINDRHGHKAGDDLLKAIADRLSQMVRASDTIARYGGDEFTLIMPALSCEEDALTVARKITTAFHRPFAVGEEKIAVTASIGVAIYPTHGTDSDTLLSKADNAMYRAKAMGRNKYCCYGNPSGTTD